MPNLVGVSPKDVMIHGITKRYVDKYHWHSPNVGIVASFTPRGIDVADHFGMFRGVDQIEAFAQATTGSCNAYLEAVKHKYTLAELKDKFTPTFIGVGQVNFRGFLLEGDTFISIGRITFYKFRQMSCEGRIYKAPKGLDLDEYFKDYTEERLLAYDLDESFELIAELFDITGKAVKKEKFL